MKYSAENKLKAGQNGLLNVQTTMSARFGLGIRMRRQLDMSSCVFLCLDLPAKLMTRTPSPCLQTAPVPWLGSTTKAERMLI